MIHRLSSSYPIDLDEHGDFLGGKALSLVRLINGGFSLPSGIILDSRTFLAEMERSGLFGPINEILADLTADTIASGSKRLLALFDHYHFSSELAVDLSRLLDPWKAYAVRSSATLEDSRDQSFAGQYDSLLRLRGISAITKAIRQCYRSLFGERSLSYLAGLKNSFHISDLSMAVIIQEMVDARAAGVLFTAHPIRGEDRVMALEIAKGTAEDLVSGKIRPLSLDLPWFELLSEADFHEAAMLDITIQNLLDLRRQALQVARLFGYPLDIEFAWDENGRVMFLQARAITRFRYEGIRGQWTTADFKDGGVSAEVCRQYMWSLYETAWESSLASFLREGKLINPPPGGDYARMYFGRPYWNLDIVKAAMKKVPGYSERAFDTDLGIGGSYDGDGETTPVTAKNILAFLPIALAQNKLLKKREAESQELRSALLAKIKDYHSRLDQLERDSGLEEIADVWTKIHYDCYLSCEGSYFRQIFLNTIHQIRIRDSLLKQMDRAAYLSLLGGLEEVSHLLPFYDLWALSRKIRENSDTLRFWQEASVNELSYIYKEKREDHEIIRDLELWFEAYGYHSTKELDVSRPNFSEEAELIIGQLKTMINWPDELSPEADKEASRAAYDQARDSLETRLGRKKTEKIERKIERMRALLWWREEFRDISTRSYDLIRRAALLLATRFHAAGVLEHEEDIWQLKIGQIRQYLSGEIEASDLRGMVREALVYYDAYRNYLGDNEIPAAVLKNESGHFAFDRNGSIGPGEKLLLRGIPAGSGRVRGRARVIRSQAEIDRLEEGDILVTRFTDTGWTVKFAILAGIVTEYGGVLSHAAIVSREYNIPCIVGATNAMSLITDGDEILIDGAGGQIWQIATDERGTR